MAGDMSAIIITITERNKCFPTITEYIAEIKLDTRTIIIIFFDIG